MRRAEIIAAGILAVLSVYFMWMSMELPIGWVPERGPGGGAFPFALSTGMLVCSVVILLQAWFRRVPENVQEAPFLDPETRRLLVVIGSALVIMVGLVHFVGMYVSIPLFVIFYMRYLGHHRWHITLTMAVIIPVGTFLFFEKLILILLPKGITERWFYIFF
ncbi:MAG: tripartite tricarboxylate transporter TctB family protein [Deltaproteobacteria bacterium]|nr:tripartite tricarboxylate transporter TctB family protein [Deltaproteobacteria bacterium]